MGLPGWMSLPGLPGNCRMIICGRTCLQRPQPDRRGGAAGGGAGTRFGSDQGVPTLQGMRVKLRAS
jgi:hypothetical protein